MMAALESRELWRLFGLPNDGWLTSNRKPTEPLLQLRAETPGGTGSISIEWSLPDDDVLLGVFGAYLKAPLRIERCLPVESVLLNFTVSGMAVSHMQGVARESVDREGEVCLVAPHGGRMRAVNFAEPGENRIIQVLMSGQGFDKFVREFGIELNPEQRRRFLAGNGSIVDRRPISPQLALAIDQLIHTNPGPAIRGAYLHAKALELIALYAGSWNARTPRISRPKIQPAVVDRLERARALMLSDLASAPSISELAKRVRLGESTLTHGFRACFGQSVHAFLLETRLERARQLIREESWRLVSDIAYEVGFKCPSRFANLFTQRYGVLPRVYRESFR